LGLHLFARVDFPDATWLLQNAELEYPWINGQLPKSGYEMGKKIPNCKIHKINKYEAEASGVISSQAFPRTENAQGAESKWDDDPE
jgi:hypothetical protein